MLRVPHVRFNYTRRGRSWARHVRDCEANIERAKNCGLGHLRRLKSQARTAELTIGLRGNAHLKTEQHVTRELTVSSQRLLSSCRRWRRSRFNTQRPPPLFTGSSHIGWMPSYRHRTTRLSIGPSEGLSSSPNSQQQQECRKTEIKKFSFTSSFRNYPT